MKLRIYLLTAILCSLQIPSYAVEQVEVAPETEYEQAFAAQQKALTQQADDLRSLIDKAQGSMASIKNTNLQAMNSDSIKQRFIQFRAKIQSLLQNFDDQGDFTISLHDALLSAQRALGWWKSQPKGDDQQTQVNDLQKAVATYIDADRQREKIKADCETQLQAVLRRELTAERIAATRNISAAAQQLDDVIKGMQTLTTSLKDLGNTGSTKNSGS